MRTHPTRYHALHCARNHSTHRKPCARAAAPTACQTAPCQVLYRSFLFPRERYRAKDVGRLTGSCGWYWDHTHCMHLLSAKVRRAVLQMRTCVSKLAVCTAHTHSQFGPSGLALLALATFLEVLWRPPDSHICSHAVFILLRSRLISGIGQRHLS